MSSIDWENLKVDEFVTTVINMNWKLEEYLKNHGKELNENWHNFLENFRKVIDYSIFIYEEDDYE